MLEKTGLMARFFSSSPTIIPVVAGGFCCGDLGRSLTNIDLPRTGESWNPVTATAQHETQRRWVPDIALPFRDDEQKQSSVACLRASLNHVPGGSFAFSGNG